MLLQGAQHAVCGNKAACLEQNTWTLSLRYALCETSFLFVSQTKPLPIFSDLQKRQVPLLHVWECSVLPHCGWKGIWRAVPIACSFLLCPQWDSILVFITERKMENVSECRFKAERKDWEEILQEFIPLPACSSQWSLVSLPKNCIGGCHHHFTCMGTLVWGYPQQVWGWKLVETDIFSQSEMWAHLVQAHWSLSSLYTLGSDLEQFSSLWAVSFSLF